MDKIKCLDTYALVEIFFGNKKFINYLNAKFVITDITLVEFYGVLLREEGESEADYWFKKLEQYAISVNKNILKESVKFKFENRKTNISFFDAVGYIYSLYNNYMFVTGDKKFENFKCVEFIKK